MVKPGNQHCEAATRCYPLGATAEILSKKTYPRPLGRPYLEGALFAVASSSRVGRRQRARLVRRQCAPRMERREAQHPDRKGCARLRTARGPARSQGRPKGASQAPGASRRSIPLLGKEKREAAYPGPTKECGRWRLATFQSSSPRKRGPIRRSLTRDCGVWVPGLALLARDDRDRWRSSP